jgi:hypothetical protein
MGLFASLFGSGGSDQADKLRQDALNAFNSIQTPELSQLQVQLQKYVDAGQLTPQQAESQLLSSNAFNSIVTDPSYVGAQKQALQQLQQIGTQGGLTAEDKARLQDITNQQNQQVQSENAATMQQSQERGVGGSDLNTIAQLQNEQGAADRASQQGTDVAAQAQARALQAMQAAGSQGGALEAQQYGEQANKAQAQNAIDLFNTQTLNQQNLYNTQTANAAQAANLANKQAVSNANTATGNSNAEYNAQQVQQQYQDALNKASGEAGIYNGWANSAQNQAEQERNASAGLVQGALQAGGAALGGAMAGPAGAAAGSAAGSTSFNPKTMSTNPYDNTETSFAHGGEVTCDHPEHPEHMAMGGTAHCYAYGGEVHHHPDCYMSKGGKTPHFLEGLKKGALHKDLHVSADEPIPAKKLEKATHSENETVRKRAQFAENAKHWHHGKDGGEVPGKAKVAGDSPKNDTVNAKLSPGEVVAPRSAMTDDEEFDKFMEKFRPSNQHKMATGGVVPPSIPRVNDANPMRDVVKSPSANPVPLAATNDTNDFTQFMHKFNPNKKVVAPPHVPMEAKAIANLHKRVSNLEGSI